VSTDSINSKQAANVLFTVELERRLKMKQDAASASAANGAAASSSPSVSSATAAAVKVVKGSAVALHPGVVQTDLARWEEAEQFFLFYELKHVPVRHTAII
jgi:hypothetical protein